MENKPKYAPKYQKAYELYQTLLQGATECENIKLHERPIYPYDLNRYLMDYLDKKNPSYTEEKKVDIADNLICSSYQVLLTIFKVVDKLIGKRLYTNTRPEPYEIDLGSWGGLKCEQDGLHIFVKVFSYDRLVNRYFTFWCIIPYSDWMDTGELSEEWINDTTLVKCSDTYEFTNTITMLELVKKFSQNIKNMKS